MKILIVGGTSSLAKALQPILSNFSEVITAGRKDCDITMDLTDPVEKIKLPNDIDVIINTAAHFGGKSPKEILAAENINVLGALKVCHAAVQAGAKHMILISSIFAILEETSPFYDSYALSKKHAEEATDYFCTANDLPLTILRPSQIYGGEDYFREHQPFFYTIVDTAEVGKDITLYGSHDASRNYIHADDVATIIAKVIQKKIVGIYSCQYQTNVKYSQIGKAALTAFKGKGKVRFLRDKPDILDNTAELDDSLYKKINYYPSISVEDGMRDIAKHRGVHP